MHPLRTEPGFSTGAVFAQSFSTKNLRAKDQFDAWRSLLAGTIDLLPTPEALRSFEADFFSWTFGDLVLTRAHYANAPARHWRHWERSFMDHWCIVLAYSHPYGCDRFASAAPGYDSLRFRSLAKAFEARADETEVLTLFLLRGSCREEVADFERAHDRDIDPSLGAVLAGYVDHLAGQLPHISAQHAQGLAVATRSLVAACIAPSMGRLEAAEAPLASLLTERARVLVRQSMASPDFGPEQLARLMAMSRSKLYRLFESTGGVAHFINRERLHEAHRRLTHRDAPPIHVIGNEVGFADHSTFSRAFRREFGYSPTEARERSLARVSPARPEVAPRNGRGDGQSGSPDRVRDHVFHSGYSLMPQLVLERSVAAPSSASDGKRGAPKIGMTSAKLGF